MKFRFNPLLAATEEPPIAELQGSVNGSSPSARRPVIDLLQAVPGYPPDPGLVAHVAEMAADSRVSLYTPIQGTKGLRAALAADISAVYRGKVSPQQICITAGCNQAFYAAAIALARAGDNVVLAVPYYFNHRMTLDMLGIETRMLPTREAAGFVPDPGEAAGLIDDRTRALVLVTPNNPTGAVYPPEILERFHDLAAGRRLALILDETYRDFLPLSQTRAHELFSRPEWDETLIHLYSFSKAYSLTGYRVGALAASPAFIAQFLKIMDCLVICAPHIAQIAAQFGLERLGEWRRSKRELMAGRVDAFRCSMAESGGRWTISSVGAYFAYVRHPFAGHTAAETARRLAVDQGLLCLPGSVCGPDQESYLRVAFANVEIESIPEIASRFSLAASS